MRIFVLLSLLIFPVLVGCGKKTESGHKIATDSDGQTVESTNGVSAETSASPENQLIGEWASDFKKTLDNLKVLKANATDDFVKEKIYGPQIKEFEEGTNRDSWPGAMQTKLIIQFTKDGKMKAFAKGSEIIGTYSIVDTEDASLSWRLDGGIGGSEGLFITLVGDTLQLSQPPDPASPPFPILFSRTEEPPAAKSPEGTVQDNLASKVISQTEEPPETKSPEGALQESIVGKVITVALNERMQPQMMFNANGAMLVSGQDGELEDRGLTYKIKGNEVLVFEDGERDGGILFSSSSPKAGDQVEMGSEDDKRKVTIIKIEQADEIHTDKKAQKKALGNASQIKNLSQLKGLQICLYAEFGKLGSLPDRPLEEMIIAKLGTTKITRFTHPETGEIRHVLYNQLTDFGPRFILLASPWVHGGLRAVVYGDGRGEIIAEAKYQQEIQEEKVEMRSLK